MPVDQRNAGKELAVQETQDKKEGKEQQRVSNDRYTEDKQGVLPLLQYT